MTIKQTIDRDGESIIVTCEFAYHNASRGSRCPKWGTPLEPDVADELEFIAATIGAIEVELTKAEIDAAKEAAWKQIGRVNL